MALTYYSGEIRGLSSDTKPTTVPNGSKFYETDTKKKYMLISGVWTEQVGGGGFDALYDVFFGAPTSISVSNPSSVTTSGSWNVTPTSLSNVNDNDFNTVSSEGNVTDVGVPAYVVADFGSAAERILRVKYGRRAGASQTVNYYIDVSLDNSVWVRIVTDVHAATTSESVNDVIVYFGTFRYARVGVDGTANLGQQKFLKVYEIRGEAGVSAIAKQRYVEWFSGNDVDAGIWTKRNITGSGTFQTSDNADEGYEIVLGTTASACSQIDFNDKNAFSPISAVALFVTKRTTANTQLFCGTCGAANTVVNYAVYKNNTNDSFKALETHDGSSTTTSNSDVAIDTNWTVAKLVYGASDIKMYINGVLKVTKTTNRPTAAQQPLFRTQSITDTTTGKTVRIRYYEVYNT